MEPSEIEQNINKIKGLLKSEDFDVVSSGIDLAQTLNEKAIYERLLEGCGVDKKGRLVNEKKEISDYLVCTLSSLSDGNKAKEIKEKITVLYFYDERNMANVDGLANLKNLTELYLIGCKSLTNVDGLVRLTNLTKINLSYCNSLTNLDVLANLKNLDYLGLSSNLLTHFEKLEGSTNIITLDFSGDNMTELPVVPEFFKNTKEVILSECYDLEDLEGLVNFPDVTYLDLSCCFENDREEMISEWGSAILPFPSLEVLTRLKKLKKLDLSSSEYHHDLSPVLFLDNLNELILGSLGSGAEKIYDWLNNETEPKLTNLTKLELMYCESLTNVNGLANLPNLNSLRLDGCYSINVIPDGYNKQVLEDQEDVVVEGEELKSYLQKIRISSNNKSVDQKNKEIQVTLFARELTFCDLEFEESDISSIDKIQNLIDEVIEFNDEERTSHMILGSIDNNNKQKLSEKRYSAKNYYEEKSFTISINNLGNLVNEPSQKKIKLLHYYYYDNSSYILKLNGLNKKLLIDVKNFDSEAIILQQSTKNYELDLLYANTGGLYRIACMFDDGHIIKGTISEKSKFIDEVFKYHKNK